MATGEGAPHIDNLRQLLAADFRSPETREAQSSATAGSLAWVLAHTADAENVEARLMSAESEQLGDQVRQNLEGAVVTDSFKDFVVNAVRQAHASEATVSEEVAAVNLGLDDESGGIFNPEQAPDIEAGFLRGRLYNIISQYVVVAIDENSQPTRIILYPHDYAVEIMVLEQWISEYMDVHGRNPFEDIDMGAYVLAAQEAHLVTRESEEGRRFSGLLERLEQLRQQQDGDI